MIALTLLAAAAPVPYRALGTEPFWSLTIGPREMRLSEPGRPDTTLPTPPARELGGRRRYSANDVSVLIVRGPCSDGMSDRRYPDRVTVRWRGRVLQGCGGGATAPAPPALEGTQWRVVAIDGRAVPAAATIHFDGGRVTGSAGCNRFTGGWRMERDRLTLDRLALTRRACVGAAGAVEARFVAIAGTPLALERRADGRVDLRGTAGTLTLAPL